MERSWRGGGCDKYSIRKEGEDRVNSSLVEDVEDCINSLKADTNF